MKKRYMALLLTCAVFMGACSTNTASTGGSSTTDSPATASTEATTDAAAEASTASEANTGETTTEEGDPTYAVVVKDGVSYLPVAEIASAIGYTVSGDGPEVKISNGNWDVTINGENQTLEASYQEGSIPVEATVEGDIVYLSEKAIHEYVNVDVVIEGESATATVSAVAAARDAIRGNEYGIKASFEYETYEVMLPMEDGVELRTIVYKPVGDGPFPTAFTRGPYPGQEPTKMALGEEYAKRGVAYVFQYCRGKGGSGGEYVANVDERRDGDASLQWLNNEPWVESIGMHGHSYLALTTWIVGDILPEKVKALHVQCYGVLRNLSVSHSGLVATDNICAWTLGNCTDVGFDYDLYLESAQYLPQIEVDEALWGGKVEGYADWVNHPDFTDAYWNEGVWGDLKNA
ncbi:MAG: CocE/NonD family hydrolase, partial [Lachnospiraceae bacterium]|nr:CocE/NonD family hydrolase [Lachnospiraceae bacterium]